MKMKGIVIVSLSLGLAAILGLSACSAPSPGPTQTPPPSQTAQPTIANTPTPAPTPIETITPTPSPSPTPEPTASPAPAPTADPDAPPTIGLYNRKTRALATGYNANLIKGENNAEFFALPTNKESVDKSTPKALVEKYWGRYRQDGYKIGYIVDITLKSGEVIHLNIRRPKDAPPIQHEPMYFSKFVEIYMYDNAKRDPDGDYGSWHLQERFIKDGEKVLITSIKFHAGSKYSEVASIGVTAYTYKNDSEFDPQTGEYNGLLSYHILITRE
jgi:hypothetical protein